MDLEEQLDNNDIPKFDLIINNDNLEESIVQILIHLRPDWVNIPSNKEKLKSKELTGGISNRLLGYFLQDHPRDTLVFRIYGEKTEDIIDRQKEIQTMTLLKQLGVGAELYGIFNNGIVYEYIPGETVNVDNCQIPEISSLIASQMGQLHSIPLIKANCMNTSCDGIENSFEFRPILWDLLVNFKTLGEAIFKSNKKLEKEFQAIGITPAWSLATIEEFKRLVEKESMPIVFAHNDLLLGNIIYDEEKSKVTFIDFEYSGANYAPFDVANHFNEHAGVDDVDFSRYPTKEFQSKWIEIYLKNVNSSQQKNKWDQKIFERWVTLCTPLSHFCWILWCVVQAGNSKLDFDFVNYARQRFPEFQKRMLHVRELFGNKSNI